MLVRKLQARQIVALTPSRHVSPIRVCAPTSVSCCGMSMLLLLLLGGGSRLRSVWSPSFPKATHRPVAGGLPACRKEENDQPMLFYQCLLASADPST
jgi:hypothetical protein